MSVHDRVLSVVKEVPGAEATDIVELLPNCNESTVRAALSVLAKENKLSRQKTYRETPFGKRMTYLYRPADKAAAASLTQPQPAPAKRKRAGEEVANLRGRLAAAEEELTTLRQWKAEAIERHPDLRVKQEVIEARKIVSQELLKTGDKARASDVSEGRSDNSIIMRAVVAALEARS
jgi:hypothetical protein